MLTDKEKLTQLMQKENLNQSKLAALTDVKQQVISRLLTSKDDNDKATPALKYALLKYFGFDIDTGEYTHIQTERTDDNIIPIPTHDISASAGAGTWVDQEPEQDVLYFDKRFLKQRLKRDDFSSLHIIHAQGDSMDSGWNQPDDIKDGDLLMVDTSQTTGNNQIFVILVNNRELRVKRLTKRGDTLYITSNNPKYKEEIYRPDDTEIEVKVIGKVVWNGSKE
jgi:phage repressor protein C with HTH and peptisase S24 domain